MTDSAAQSLITEEQVRQLAWLARLTLTDADVAHFTDELGKVLAHMERLAEVDVEGIEPTAMAVQAEGNVVRADVPRPACAQETILANAADTEAGCFRVRAMLEESA
ncbi:MAG TPA: Asp-tRNA(Asn)/Glu-tRNA(Gln) amidotransferase GatCAB subunit C [Armatimonadetes bacterium]|nr:Asp-tRNA(Asn)/Glu-tRNA(Gln) amidotransferase GatCAB subunit C [Armatimonadota bacterium]